MGEAMWKGILYKTDILFLGKGTTASLKGPCKGKILQAVKQGRLESE